MMLICLSGTILSGLSLNSWQDVDAHLETSSEAPDAETAAVLPPGTDTAVILSDSPAGKQLF